MKLKSTKTQNDITEKESAKNIEQEEKQKKAKSKKVQRDIVLTRTKREKIQSLFIYFLIYSFLGWLLETVYALMVEQRFIKRGFLYGPFCPIYGFGAVIIIVLLYKSKGKPLKEFVLGSFTFTVFEFVVSFALEAVFRHRWWDYTEELLNLQGRVSLMYSILWGAMGIILIEWVHPFISKRVKKIKKYISLELENTIVIILILYIIMDFVASSAKYLSL